MTDIRVGPSTPKDHDHTGDAGDGGLLTASSLSGTPGGELGGTWASPTVDATHSGSSHAGVVSTHEAASDPHTGYVLESLLDAKGDLIAGSADNTPAKVTVGANDTILMADSAQTAGLKWVGSQTPVAVGSGAAAEGSADTYSRGDHIHAPPDYILIRDEKAQNTAGGTFTSGAWRTRDLNTEVVDTGSLASVASNQITLNAGTYVIRASAPAYSVNSHQTRLQNVTDASTVLIGTSEYNRAGTGPDYPSGRSWIIGRFTIASSKTFEVQHQAVTTGTTSGFGVAGNLTTEVYTVVELWRVA